MAGPLEKMEAPEEILQNETTIYGMMQAREGAQEHNFHVRFRQRELGCSVASPRHWHLGLLLQIYKGYFTHSGRLYSQIERKHFCGRRN